MKRMTHLRFWSSVLYLAFALFRFFFLAWMASTAKYRQLTFRKPLSQTTRDQTKRYINEKLTEPFLELILTIGFLATAHAFVSISGGAEVHAGRCGLLRSPVCIWTIHQKVEKSGRIFRGWQKYGVGITFYEFTTLLQEIMDPS